MERGGNKFCFYFTMSEAYNIIPDQKQVHKKEILKNIPPLNTLFRDLIILNYK